MRGRARARVCVCVCVLDWERSVSRALVVLVVISTDGLVHLPCYCYCLTSFRELAPNWYVCPTSENIMHHHRFRKPLSTPYKVNELLGHTNVSHWRSPGTGRHRNDDVLTSGMGWEEAWQCWSWSVTLAVPNSGTNTNGKMARAIIHMNNTGPADQWRESATGPLAVLVVTVHRWWGF